MSCSSGIALGSMNDTFGIEITYFGRPFRAGLGWPHPGLKPRLRKAYVAASYLELTDHQTRARRSVAKEALGCSVLPLRGKTGGLFRILGSLHPDGPERYMLMGAQPYHA